MGTQPKENIYMPVSFQGIRSASAIGVPQGGTGNSSIPAGEILVGDGTNPIYSIPVGSEGQVLTVVNGEWASADAAAGSGGSGGLSSITTSGNLQGNGTSGSPATLKSAISLTSVTASFKGDGSQITGLTAAQVSGIISSVSSSGNLQGDGTSGSALTLKDNISLSSVTASFSGNGSALTNLTASQIGGLNAAVDARITNIPNSALQHSTITINGEEVALGGIFTINVPQGFGGVTTSGSISGDGLSAPITLNDNISLTSVTASFNGSGAGLTNIPNAALTNNSITINGSPVSLGGSVTIQTSSANPSFTSVTASYYTGSYIGNGSALTNLSSSQISNFNSAVDARITNIPNSALQNSSITINGSSVSLGGSATIADQSSMTFTGSGFTAGDVVALSGSLVKADYSDDTKSNAFGVVSAVAGTTVTVKVFGEATALSASSYSTAGTLLYVGISGSVTNYAGIPSGKYITQVGILSPNSGKLIIQPRIYGQKN